MDKLEVVTDAAKPKVWPIFVAIGLVVAVWGANWLFLAGVDDNERGTFGDMFGAANALFSGAALAGVIYAILLQRHEISIAKRELRYTREILKDQTKNLELQNAATGQQIFEGTFFQLLSILVEITNQIDLDGNRGKSNGKDALKIFKRRAYSLVTPSYDVMSSVLEDFESEYEIFFKQNGHELGHYFRTLYNLIKFVDKSDAVKKRFYTSLVRAQMSDDEAALLYLNGLSKYGNEKFKPLIERYGLLKNVREADFLHEDLKRQYSATAFE